MKLIPFAVGAVGLLAAAACTASIAADRDFAQGSVGLSDMQLTVKPLAGNTGSFSVTFPSIAHQEVAAFVQNPPHGWASSSAHFDQDVAYAQAGTEGALASGQLTSMLLDGAASAQVDYTPGGDQFAQGALSGAYYPVITPFTEVTLSGKLSAWLSDGPDGAGMAYSVASFGVLFGPESFFRHWNVRDVSGMLEDQFSLTFRNDTAFERSFDWYTAASITAAVPEPAQALTLLAGLAIIGWLGRRRTVLSWTMMPDPLPRRLRRPCRPHPWLSAGCLPAP